MSVLHYVQLRIVAEIGRDFDFDVLHYVQLVIKNKSLFSMQAFLFLFLFIINFEKYVIIIIRYNLKWK